MNRINRLFENKPAKVLSIYFTAGFPALESTVPVIRALARAGADMVEIGIPFSDPMADGPVIQKSSTKALKNGMSLKVLFNQLKSIRNEVDIPLLLMGYLNPVLQYGIGQFCSDCEQTGIDGAILPDLPLEEFLGESGSVTGNRDSINHQSIHSLFQQHGLHNILLISPQTSNERIRKIDRISKGFIYMVSSSSTTGVKSSFSTEQVEYFKRIQNMELKNPALIGFGISDSNSFAVAGKYAHGAIIGSAFVKMLGEKGSEEKEIVEFISGIKGEGEKG
jgi:tryptophan synthase alpha chain